MLTRNARSKDTHLRKKMAKLLTAQTKKQKANVHQTAQLTQTTPRSVHQKPQPTPDHPGNIGGDFFNKSYFLAWMDLARHYAPTWFYAYTKRIDLWMTASTHSIKLRTQRRRGGKSITSSTNTNSISGSRIQLRRSQAKGLELDHDDSKAYTRGPSFGQLIHGTQPAQSEARKPLRFSSYRDGRAIMRIPRACRKRITKFFESITSEELMRYVKIGQLSCLRRSLVPQPLAFRILYGSHTLADPANNTTQSKTPMKIQTKNH